MATVIAAKASMAPRIMALHHATIPSIDVMADLEFYEKYLGANLMPRTPGEPRSFDYPAPFVNLKTERIKAGRHCNCFIEFAGISGFGLFLQSEYPPEPERLLQGPRYGLAVADDDLKSAAKVLSEGGVEFLGPVAQEAESPFSESIYFKDPSGNSLEVSAWREPTAEMKKPAGRRGLIPLTGIVHVAVDVTDLDQAEDFYAAGVGFALSHRDTTADGLEKSVLRSRAGHILTLQHVDTIPERTTWKTSGKCHFALLIDGSGWDTFSREMEIRKVEVLPETANAAQGHKDGRDIYTRDPGGNILQVFAGHAN